MAIYERVLPNTLRVLSRLVCTFFLVGRSLSAEVFYEKMPVRLAEKPNLARIESVCVSYNSPENWGIDIESILQDSLQSKLKHESTSPWHLNVAALNAEFNINVDIREVKDRFLWLNVDMNSSGKTLHGWGGDVDIQSSDFFLDISHNSEKEISSQVSAILSGFFQEYLLARKKKLPETRVYLLNHAREN